MARQVHEGQTMTRDRARHDGAERSQSSENEVVSREELIELLNGDLSREYQAIIAYVVYSQTIKGAQYMSIAEELQVHATEELNDDRHASFCLDRAPPRRGLA